MTNPEKLKAILNLACVVMSRKSTPAMIYKAETLLSELLSEEEVDSDQGMQHIPTGKTWLQQAREACPDWREL